MDLVSNFVPALVSLASIKLFKIEAPDIEFMFFAFVLVNPLAIYALSTLFENEQKASIVVRIFYFVFGGVAPIAI